MFATFLIELIVATASCLFFFGHEPLVYCLLQNVSMTPLIDRPRHFVEEKMLIVFLSLINDHTNLPCVKPHIISLKEPIAYPLTL